MESIGLIAMALLLGLRHGLDLDHLATIDAVTRTVRVNRSFVGALFSLGHGFVVTLISVVIGSGLVRLETPEWLEGVGTVISVAFLLFFGFLNLWSVFSQSKPSGFKIAIAEKLGTHPAGILLIGALFALSFDTISQVALFALSASLVSGALLAVILGLSFTAGMVCSDGVNGLLVSKVIQRADGLYLGLAISLFSLGTGFYSLYSLIA